MPCYLACHPQSPPLTCHCIFLLESVTCNNVRVTLTTRQFDCFFSSCLTPSMLFCYSSLLFRTHCDKSCHKSMRAIGYLYGHFKHHRQFFSASVWVGDTEKHLRNFQPRPGIEPRTSGLVVLSLTSGPPHHPNKKINNNDIGAPDF